MSNITKLVLAIIPAALANQATAVICEVKNFNAADLTADASPATEETAAEARTFPTGAEIDAMPVKKVRAALKDFFGEAYTKSTEDAERAGLKVLAFIVDGDESITPEMVGLKYVASIIDVATDDKTLEALVTDVTEELEAILTSDDSGDDDSGDDDSGDDDSGDDASGDDSGDDASGDDDAGDDLTEEDIRGMDRKTLVELIEENELGIDAKAIKKLDDLRQAVIDAAFTDGGDAGDDAESAYPLIEAINTEKHLKVAGEALKAMKEDSSDEDITGVITSFSEAISEKVGELPEEDAALVTEIGEMIADDEVELDDKATNVIALYVSDDGEVNDDGTPYVHGEAPFCDGIPMIPVTDTSVTVIASEAVGNVEEGAEVTAEAEYTEDSEVIVFYAPVSGSHFIYADGDFASAKVKKDKPAAKKGVTKLAGKKLGKK